VRSLALILLVAVASASAQTPGFWLMGLGTGATQGAADGLSQDGLVAVGSNYGLTSPTTGFRWTRQEGRLDFSSIPGMPDYTPAAGVSSDGGVVAGSVIAGGQPIHPYRWTGAGPLQDLGVLPNESRGYSRGISGDGSIVVGACEHSASTEAFGQAFRWTAQEGMVGLGYARPSGSFSQARGISRDGSTIVGRSQSGGPGGPDEPFVWTSSNGMQALPTLAGSPVQALANAVSAHGEVIVGQAQSAFPSLHSQAVLWSGGSILNLGILPGYVDSVAFAVSDDGTVVGGSINASLNFAAFVWSPGVGMQLLSDRLLAAGVAIPSNYRLESVLAMSGDGLTFAGQAHNLTNSTYEGFVATIPPPASILVLLLPALARRKRPAA
jgi:probable HAF family extracellular repeat protein